MGVLAAGLVAGSAQYVATAEGFATREVASSPTTPRVQRSPLFPAANGHRQGFVRIINHAADAGRIVVHAFDDEGRQHGPLTLDIDARQTAHFNSGDLEHGNSAKRLTGQTGAGQGDWRLEFETELDIEVLSYIRTTAGFLTAMHDTVPMHDGGYQIATFNPGSNQAQESRLRLVNPGHEDAVVHITGVGDAGDSPGAGSTVTLPARASRTYTAAQLESGGAEGLQGAIGDGTGKWRLVVSSAHPILVMSLLASPTGHLTNLSTARTEGTNNSHAVPLFPAASDPNGRQGFVRTVNRSDVAGEVTIRAFDGTARRYEGLTLSIAANETKHFNSEDLESGNPAKGLQGSTGTGDGDWHLLLTSDLDIEVLAYIRTRDGFLTAMHDVAPAARGRHRIVTFNPGSNTAQRSELRMVNPGEEAAVVTIAGLDDRGEWIGSDVQVSVPAQGSATLSAAALESGGMGFAGALGDGSGKWQLVVDSDRAIRAMSLLSSPTGHLTNLSTAPGRDEGPPILLSPGAIAMEWGTWGGEVRHDTLGFRQPLDLEGDGDDDLILTSYSQDPDRPGEGVVLVNNGDFTFTVAAGDRPGGVHPGEILSADFDGDGMNDLFIADVGLDTPPFPGWHNQLLLWTPDGYRDATENMPSDPTGFTHNAAVGDVDGDGDIDVLVANAFGDWIFGPYLLINDGKANFFADRERLPASMKTHYRPWAVEIADLDGDGHEDLVAGATSDDQDGESFVYWGSQDGEYRDDNATVIPKAAFFSGFDGADVVFIGVHDCDTDGHPDLLLGGYDAATSTKRGVQLIVNKGGRRLVDETRYRLGDSAWSLTEAWQGEYLFFDLNHDGTADIVPQHYGTHDDDGGPNIMAWLNDGACRYVALRTTAFDDASALWNFAWGAKVRVGAEFKSMYFRSESGTHLRSNSAVVVDQADVTLAP